MTASTPLTPSPGAQPPAARASRTLLTGIFLAVFFAYLFSSGRERPWADATPIWQVAASLVDHGGVDIPSPWPANMPRGRNGLFYALNPLLTSLMQVPGAAIQATVVKRWPEAADYSWPLACHLGPALLGALTCVLFFLLCLEHGLPARIATLTTLSLAFASTVWVYSRYPYSEVLQMLCFTAVFLQLVRLVRAPSARIACALGLWTGLLADSKTVYLAALPGVALFLAWTWRRDPRLMLRMFAWIAATFVPVFFGMYFFYNWLRWGSITSSGYSGLAILSKGNAWTGFWGMLISPGKSLFLYSPPIFLALFGLRTLFKRAPNTLILMALATVPVLFVYARFPFWHGDYAWGPRYVVFAIPVFCLPLTFVFQWVSETASKIVRTARASIVTACLLAGIAVQILGNAFYWDHWIRISAEARGRWLGSPNRAGAASPDHGGICDACFEDTHQLHWLPQFQPIRGHWWLLRHVPFGHDWKTAEPDAPWHPETTLQLNVETTYRRVQVGARVDWWILMYNDHKNAARILAFVLALGGLTGALLWRQGTRPRHAAATLEATPAPAPEPPVTGEQG